MPRTISPSTYFVLIREEDSKYRAPDGTYVLKISEAQKFPSEAQAESQRNLFSTEFVVGVADHQEHNPS